MDFSLGAERMMLRDSLSRWLADHHDIRTRNRLAASEPGFDRGHWAALVELGVVGALFTEAEGGFGGDPFDVTTVFEVVGRALYAGPLLANLMAGRMLAGAGRTDELAAIIAGEKLAALAHFEHDGRYDPDHTATTVTAVPGGWHLRGAKTVVLNGDSADWLIVTARQSGDAWDRAGRLAFVVPADAVSRRGYPTIDGLRAAELRIDTTLPASACLGEATPLLDVALAVGTLAVSAEAVGAMEVLRDMTVEYLRTRKQFGRPIGSFQALQHRMATIYTEIEQARSAVLLAAGTNSAKALAGAKAMVGRIGQLVAEEAIQMHGGIGMTWELDAPHYAKRLIMIDHQLGDVDYHMARYIALSRAA